MSRDKLFGKLSYIIESFNDFNFEDEAVFTDPEFSRIVNLIAQLTDELKEFDYSDFEDLRQSVVGEMDVQLKEALRRTRSISPSRSNEVMRRLQLLRSFVQDKAKIPSQIFDAKRDFDEHYEETLGYDDFIDKVLSVKTCSKEELFEDPDLWFRLATWGKTTSGITPRARQIVFYIGLRIRKNEEVSDRQKAAGESILRDAKRKGFDLNGQE